MKGRVVAHPALGALMVDSVIRRAEERSRDPAQNPEYRRLMGLDEKAPPKRRAPAAKPMTPAEAVDALCGRLAAQRDALDAQITGLRLATAEGASEVTGDVVVALYLSLGSAIAVVQFADEQGWRLPSKKGEHMPMRRYSTAEVYALLRSDPCAIPAAQSAALLQMAQKRLAIACGRSLFG